MAGRTIFSSYRDALYRIIKCFLNKLFQPRGKMMPHLLYRAWHADDGCQFNLSTFIADEIGESRPSGS